MWGLRTNGPPSHMLKAGPRGHPPHKDGGRSRRGPQPRGSVRATGTLSAHRAETPAGLGGPVSGRGRGTVCHPGLTSEGLHPSPAPESSVQVQGPQGFDQRMRHRLGAVATPDCRCPWCQHDLLPRPQGLGASASGSPCGCRGPSGRPRRGPAHRRRASLSLQDAGASEAGGRTQRVGRSRCLSADSYLCLSNTRPSPQSLRRVFKN